MLEVSFSSSPSNCTGVLDVQTRFSFCSNPSCLIRPGAKACLLLRHHVGRLAQLTLLCAEHQACQTSELSVGSQLGLAPPAPCTAQSNAQRDPASLAQAHSAPSWPHTCPWACSHRLWAWMVLPQPLVPQERRQHLLRSLTGTNKAALSSCPPHSFEVHPSSLELRILQLGFFLYYHIYLQF